MKMSERLRFAAPPSLAPATTVVETTISDIERILALPRRPPVDCERNPFTKLYKPETQALIEIITERFSRGTRVSCGCRERRITKQGNQLFISLVGGAVPTAPVVTTVDAFVADLQAFNGTEQSLKDKVLALPDGQVLEVPAADNGRGHPCIQTLNAVQSWFLREAAMVGGVVGFCGVGSGKSMAFLLSSLIFPDSKKSVLLIEPKQRAHYRSQYLRLREHFRVSSISFDDGQPGYIVPGTSPLHLISYSVLSLTKNSDMLDERDPDTLMLDEAHRACGQSAINRRVKRFCAEKIKRRVEALRRGEMVAARAVRLLDASGTLENKSIEDTHMLCTFSLGMGSPLPLDPNEAEKWSGVIDPAGIPDRKSKTAKMLQRVFGDGEYNDSDLTELFSLGPEKAVRNGFRDRRLQTLGIISASASSINASMYIGERKPPKMPAAVREALLKVRTESLRPDGEVLVEKIEQISTARHVGCGFYTYWAFPKHPCTCGGIEPRCKDCLLIDDWFAKRKAYNKELRTKLQLGEAGLDSPALCWDAAERFWSSSKERGPIWEAMSFTKWKEIEYRVEYEEREKWIEDGGDWLAKDAAKWALDEAKGVVWFQSIPFGRRVAELTGLPYFNGGPGAEDRLRAQKGDRSIICSIKAHGAGTDGLQQLFGDQLIAEVPASNSSAQGWEQILGRLHREGQPRDRINTWCYLHTRELKDAFYKAYEQAEFNYEMTGNRQKLLMADMDVEGVG